MKKQCLISAKYPFIHEEVGLLEIPSDLPCFEEVGFAGAVPIIEKILEDGDIHVLPVHAEVEGGAGAQHFVELLHAVRLMD